LFRECYDGTSTTYLASNFDGAAAFDRDYDAPIVMEGSRVEVWMAEAGQTKQRVQQVRSLAVRNT
jgi:hypothetical protein